MSELRRSRKHALECMRLTAECMQLAGDLANPALQRHFLRMAKEWTALAEQAPDLDTQAGHSIH